MSRMGYRNFTEQEKQWVFENFHKFHSMAEIQADFIKHFEFRTVKSIKNLCNRHGLYKKNPSGQYGNGNRAKEQLPIGTERVSGGAIYVKVKNIPKSKGTKCNGRFPPYWLPKQRKVYEDHYGKIPEGDYFVIFLDNNNRNFNINNLYCISRKTLGIMNKNKWFTKDPLVTMTAIKCCELMQTLKGRTE